MGLIRPPKHSERVYTSKSQIDRNKLIQKKIFFFWTVQKDKKGWWDLEREKSEGTKKLRDLLKVTKGVSDRARNSGQIFWTHCPMLNPPYFTLSMVCNLLLSSSHSDVLFGKVGYSRKPRLLSSRSLSCIGSRTGAAFLVTVPQPTCGGIPLGGAPRAHWAC